MKHKKYSVYKWTNSITGRSYIGYTGDSTLFRWNKHLLNAHSGVDTYFYKSIRKYPIHVWNLQILHETCNRDEALEREKYFINFYNTLAPNGYNSSSGGTGGNTWYGPNIEKRRKKLSENNSGSGNNRAYEITDDEIIEHAVTFFESNAFRWVPKDWGNYCKMNKIPRHFVQSRFTEYGGGTSGFRTRVVLRASEKFNRMFTLDDLKYIRTASHNKNLGCCRIGKVLIYDSVDNRTFIGDKSLIDNQRFFKGKRKKHANH